MEEWWRIFLQFPMANRSGNSAQTKRQTTEGSHLSAVSSRAAQGRLKTAVDVVMCASHGSHDKSALVISRSEQVCSMPLHFCMLAGGWGDGRAYQVLMQVTAVCKTSVPKWLTMAPTVHHKHPQPSNNQVKLSPLGPPIRCSPLWVRQILQPYSEGQLSQLLYKMLSRQWKDLDSRTMKLL